MLRERFNYIIKPAYEKIRIQNKEKNEINNGEEKVKNNREVLLAYREQLNYNHDKLKMAELEIEKIISNTKNKE